MKKKILETQKYLGNNFSIRVIDMEYVIYYKVNSMYDIEISGLNNQKKAFDATVYVWEVKPGLSTTEMIDNIKSKEQLKKVVEDLIGKYRVLTILRTKEEKGYFMNINQLIWTYRKAIQTLETYKGKDMSQSDFEQLRDRIQSVCDDAKGSEYVTQIMLDVGSAIENQ